MLTTTETSHQLTRLGDAIKAYKLASGRTLAFAMIKTGREMAYALQAATAHITPSEERIRSDVRATGWTDKPRPKSKGSVGSRHVHSALVKYRGINGMIQARIYHRKYHAAGWKPAMQGFVGKGTVTTVNKRYGAVIANVDMNGICHIQLINRIGVIEQVMAQHPEIIKNAVGRVMIGFSPYIKKKLGEEAQRAFLNI